MGIQSGAPPDTSTQRGHGKVPIADCLMRHDRLALCAYQLTGQLGDSDVGSLTMFALPQGVEMTMEESFFHCIPFRELMVERLKYVPDDAGVPAAHNFVSAGVDVLERRVAELSRRVASGSYVVHPLHHAVGSETADQIAQMRPWTMSWSNVSDYFPDPAAFHACASSCSRDCGTTHHMYSMNWRFSVSGAFAMDYRSRKIRVGIKDVMEKTISSYYDGVDVSAYHKWSLGSSGRFASMLVSPPRTNALNCCDSGLAKQLGPIWCVVNVDKYFIGVHSQLFGALLIGWGSLIASPFFDNRFFHISCALLFALAQRTCDRAASVCGARSGNRLLQRGISLTGPGRPLRLLR